MESSKYVCDQHKEQVLFVCAVNQWHFQPLCQLCTPIHSQNHPKRLNVKLQSFKKIQQQTLTQKDVVLSQYQARLQQIDKMLNIKEEELTYQKELSKVQTQLIQQIKSFFNKLREQVKLNKQKFYSEQQAKINQIQNVLKSQVALMETLHNQNLDISQWRDVAKKIYFKDKMQAYLQQSKEFMEEYNKKIKEFAPFKIQPHIKISQKISQSLNTSIKLIEQPNLLKNKKKQQTNPVIKKKQPIKINKKLCKNCNQQMQYLTQWKKHLICRFCGGKERNYVKQK